MEYVALGIALVALIVALGARSTASGLKKNIADAETDARRRVENATAETEQALTVVRRTLVKVARGDRPSEAMILEGRLWRDASPQEAAALFAAGNLRVVDVRTPQETSTGIIPGALLIPVDELEARVREIPRDGQATLFYCAAGARSAAACEYLSREGYDNLINLEGGFGSWSGPRVAPK